MAITEKRLVSYHETGEKLIRFNRSFDRGELRKIFKWYGVAKQKYANGHDHEPTTFADYSIDLKPLKRERYKRGLMIIEEVLCASNPGRSINDVLSARVVDDNGVLEPKIIYRTPVAPC
jgi:hypothetical protein